MPTTLIKNIYVVFIFCHIYDYIEYVSRHIKT
jgi:hypothetical protein